jgi:yecA family protein
VEETISKRLPEDQRERLHPACAKKLIEGAIAYAEDLGFAPHRDYRKARKVLSGIDAALCPTDFTYGRDGKPCYVAGPDDSEERVERVLAILESRCGPDGFGYVYPEEGGGERDAIDDLRDALMAWLDDEPDSVPRFYQVSGLVTAMQLCPEPLSPNRVLEVLWGEEGRVWEDAEELREFTTLLGEYWNYISDLLAAATAPDAGLADQAMDVWMGDFEGEEDLAIMAATLEWATGFMRATELWPEAWGETLARPDLAEHWEIIRWWSTFIGTGNKDRIADAAEAKPPRTIGHSAIALARALRGPTGT